MPEMFVNLNHEACMLVPKFNTNHTESAPVEILDAIFQWLPSYSLTGVHSVRTVCHQWNNIISARKRKTSNEELTSSIQTEAEALLFFENTNICDEMQFTHLLRLAFKIPKVRDAIVSRLAPYDLIDISKNDVLIARYLLMFHAELLKGQMLAIINYHESLCHEHLNKYRITSTQASILSEYHISVARRILKMPESNTHTASQRYEIIKCHTKLVEENIEACVAVLDDDIEAPSSFYFRFREFIRSHRHSRVIVDLLINRYSELFNKFPSFLAQIAVYHSDIADKMFDQSSIVKKLDFELLTEMVGVHFTVAKKVIANPDLVPGKYYHFILFHILLKHFLHSKSILFDEGKPINGQFYKEYGRIFALPRVASSLNNPIATDYDFKFSLIQDLFENAELIFQNGNDIMHFLSEIIDDVERADLVAMHPAIVKLFRNVDQRDRLDRMLALKLIAEMPFLLDELPSQESYFVQLFGKNDSIISLELNNYRFNYLYKNPLLARKVMSYPSMANILVDVQQTSIESNLETRELIKQSLQSLNPSSRIAFKV